MYRKKVLISNKFTISKWTTPSGYDSVYGSSLNYPEIIVYDPNAVMPRYIIVYRKDTMHNPVPVTGRLAVVHQYNKHWSHTEVYV